jgi:hypothetical protein
MLFCTSGVGVHRENVRIGIRERLPSRVDPSGEPLSLFSGLLVERNFLEQPDGDFERFGGIEEFVLEELGQPVVRGKPILLPHGAGELRLVDTRKLLPLAGRPVEGLENFADIGLAHPLGKEPFEGLDGRLVIRRRADDFPIRGESPLDVAQFRLQDSTEAILDLQNVVGGLPDLGFAHQHGRQIGPTLALKKEPVERLDRRQILGVDVDDAPVTCDRSVGVVELHLEICAFRSPSSTKRSVRSARAKLSSSAS